MYESFFGLREAPFGMTPDPRFYYQSASHREALAALMYGVRERRGLVTLVGDVGTGKTILINALRETLDRATTVITVTHTPLDAEELLSIVLYELLSSHGPRLPAGSNGIGRRTRLACLKRVELIHELSDFVNSESSAMRPPPLLILDEAQNLSTPVLHEVRLLTNLEGPRHKLLQVVLVGQLELEHKLLRGDLRQLRQRIAVGARVESMTLAETEGYVAHRMEMAGANRSDIFAADALADVWAASGGCPRTINVICDYALVNAFAAGRTAVDRSVAKEAIRDALHYPTMGGTGQRRETSEWDPGVAGDASAGQASGGGR